MFKSLFSKLLFIITIVLTVSFLMLAAILSNFVNSYELDKQEDEIARTAIAAQSILEDSFGPAEGDIAAILAGQAERYNGFLRMFLSNTDNIVLLITDKEGGILLSADGTASPPSLSGQSVTPSVLAGVRTSGDYRSLEESILPGERRVILRALALADGEGTVIGYLFVYSTAGNWGALSRLMTRTVLLTSLWIALGALIVLYLFCERLSEPIKEMRSVSARFAKGQFDKRVSVTGDDEIAALGRAFNEMADSLEQLENMRNSFVANVSHDLRTPMTTILGFIEGMTSGVIPLDKHDYYLGVVSEEVKRLSRLVTQLLDLSRIQSGTRKFNFAKFDICEMARLILISCEQRIDAKKLEVEFDAEADKLWAYGDSDAIHQVLYNLCDNAIKFAKEGGRFSLKLTAEGKKKIAVTVFNEGEGIPEADVPYIFERFYKTDKSRGREKGGAGLGLYIAKTIMEAHKETLTLDSREGEYCAFRFTLPQIEE